ncbi:hypothetical protein LTR56_026946 [Elasticomyces elasticus]|nr:hypothetical protein LTR56_026946 [Elasticomyces elasticus]KAK3615923.1 hypothetical protein LTR22_027241 [Elasticomyces elasticus]KAK4904163.1 hypothetical protein LTR49_026338 [Elasticomyces elasticus]KAK5736874.1 hypothetical protein LTS12_026053 [Elasticomyces elasticus]
MNSHSIQDLFRTVYPFRVSMMEHLTATDLATLCYAFELSLTQQERNVYLLPTRDLLKQKQWIESRVENGAKVTMMSKDLPLWLMRIENPHRYWSIYTTHIVVRIWIIGPFSAEEQKEDWKRRDDVVMLMDGELYDGWIQHMNPSQDDIDLWYTSATMNWPDMPLQYHNLMQTMHTIEGAEMIWILPPGCWNRLVDHEGGYLASQRICDERQLRDQDQDKSWYVCSRSATNPIEIMYTPLVDNWYIDMDWMPSGLIDYSGTRIRTYSLSLSNKGEMITNVERASPHLEQLSDRDGMHVVIKGKQRSSPTSTGRCELTIAI